MAKAGDAQDHRAKRIAAARKALAEAYAQNPGEVERFHARMSRLSAAAKRERQRIDHLVLGKPRPEPVLVRPEGMSRIEWKALRKELVARGARLEPGIEEAFAQREAWSHKREATPETLAKLGLHHDALIQLQANGTIDKEQAEYAAEIANVYRSIEADVAVSIASLEARVDESRSHRHLVGESVRRVRMHRAYTIWRERLPEPRQMILDMIVGDPIGYTVAAKRYRVHNRKAKRRLIEALDLWPSCVDQAYREVGADDVQRLNAA